MPNGKKAMARYHVLILCTAKWFATGGLVVAVMILVLGIADRAIPGLNWNYSWKAVALGFVQVVIYAVVRRVAVNALNRRESETEHRE